MFEFAGLGSASELCALTTRWYDNTGTLREDQACGTMDWTGNEDYPLTPVAVDLNHDGRSSRFPVVQSEWAALKFSSNVIGDHRNLEDLETMLRKAAIAEDHNPSELTRETDQKLRVEGHTLQLKKLWRQLLR